MTGARVAAIDCGTNSIRLLVAEDDGAGGVREVVRRTLLVRLGQGVDATGEFHPDALGRTFAACDEYAALIRQAGEVDATRFVATSAARDARNAGELVAGVERRLGVAPDVISGAEEARLSFSGAASGLDAAADPVLVLDIGGGSTELIRGREGGIEQAASLDMGAVRLRERFLHGDPPTPDEVAAARAFAGDLLDGSGVELGGVGTLVGVAGTVTTMAAARLGLETYDRRLVHGHVLTPAVVHATSADWLARPVESLRTEPSMHPQRAEIICAGALILDEVVARVARDLVVSEADILDGIARDMLASLDAS